MKSSNFNSKYRIIDLSQEIYEGMPVSKDTQQTFIMTNQTHEQNMVVTGSKTLGFSARNLLISEQGPTHTKASSSFDYKGLSIDKMDFEYFYGNGICLDLSHKRYPELIEVEDIKKSMDRFRLDLKKGDVILIYTGHYNRFYPELEYSGIRAKHTGLSYECVAYLGANGIVNIGLDTPSLDSNPQNSAISGYEACYKYDITCTENLCNLRQLIGARFVYFGLPLRIRGGTGSPIRAVALIEKKHTF